MNRALVIGGSNGIGQSIVMNLSEYNHIYILDRVVPDFKLNEHMSFEQFDLMNSDYSILNKYDDINTLIITAGFGELALFKDVDDEMIINSFTVNTIAVIRIIKHFYNKINSKRDFYCVIMGSISGLISSPFFSIYGATKAALCKFIESVNAELEKNESVNKILNVSPGSIKGTKFYKEDNDLSLLAPLANEIINKMFTKNDLFIPDYESVFKHVLNNYNKDFRAFGLQSYDYKLKSGKIKDKRDDE